MIYAESAKGTHGLLRYSSTFCYGDNPTLTTPCPTVYFKDMTVVVMVFMKRAKSQLSKEVGPKPYSLQGSCLNYNLERYSCFIADIETGGSLVDGYEVKESRKA